MKIYKYPLPPKRGIFNLKVHPIVKILRVGVVKGMFPYFWAVVKDEEQEVEYNIHSFHTGEEGAYQHEFLGTVLLDGGDYVLHYFIEKRS